MAEERTPGRTDAAILADWNELAEGGHALHRSLEGLARNLLIAVTAASVADYDRLAAEIDRTIDERAEPFRDHAWAMDRAEMLRRELKGELARRAARYRH